MERYFEEEIIYFDEYLLMYWKKKSELPTLAALAKEYLGPTPTSTPSERLSQLQEISILLKEIKWVKILFAT